MTTPDARAPRVLLLIDADNVTADVIEQAVAAVLERHGAAHVRRAYCTADAAVKQSALFKRLAVRPMVNLSSGKNSTDIALAVDALDLAVAERPDVAVIVSSDSDFAPLVLRLREKGCRVEGYGQEGKVGDEIRSVYDHYVDLPHRKPRAAARASAAKAAPAPLAPPAPPAPPALQRLAPHAAPRAAPAPKPAPKPASRAAKPGAPKKAAARGAARKTTANADAEVDAMLDAMPALRGGEWVELRRAAEPLRQAGLLGKTVASTKLFRKHPALFVLEPAGQPSRVRFVGVR